MSRGPALGKSRRSAQGGCRRRALALAAGQALQLSDLSRASRRRKWGCGSDRHWSVGVAHKPPLPRQRAAVVVAVGLGLPREPGPGQGIRLRMETMPQRRRLVLAEEAAGEDKRLSKMVDP